MIQTCFCGSGKGFENCCRPFLNAEEKIDTAEKLMRSRYSAYCTQNIDYLLATTHQSTRPVDGRDIKAWAESSSFLKLDVIAVTKGGTRHKSGQVEFMAYYTDGKGQKSTHHECSNFLKENGVWFYVDGEVSPKMVLEQNKTHRNDPCPCGSGKKFKKCCGSI